MSDNMVVFVGVDSTTLIHLISNIPQQSRHLVAINGVFHVVNATFVHDQPQDSGHQKITNPPDHFMPHRYKAHAAATAPDVSTVYSRRSNVSDSPVCR